MQSLIYPLVNLIILVTFLTVKLKKPVKDFIFQRHGFFRDELRKVASQLQDAQAKYEEFSAKLKVIDSELVALRNQVVQDASATRLRLHAEANKLSDLIISDAKQSASGLYNDFRTEMRKELANGVLDRAETIIRDRLTVEDRQRIRREFSKQVEAVQ